MSTATPPPPPGPDAPVATVEGATPEERPAVRWGLRALMGLAVLSSLIWVGAILFGSTGTIRPDDYLEDRSFFTKAQPICEAARDDLDRLPRPEGTPQVSDRLEVIGRSTDRLEELLADLRPLVPDNRDGKAIAKWLEHWEIHIADRRDFMDRVERKGADERFLETTVADAQISTSINRFADVNEMPSCGTPGDV